MPENKSASFEASLVRLQEIVTELEREGVELERAVALYREGQELIARCEQLLHAADETLRAAARTATPSPNGGELDVARPDDEIPF